MMIYWETTLPLDIESYLKWIDFCVDSVVRISFQFTWINFRERTMLYYSDTLKGILGKHFARIDF